MFLTPCFCSNVSATFDNWWRQRGVPEAEFPHLGSGKNPIIHCVWMVATTQQWSKHFVMLKQKGESCKSEKNRGEKALLAYGGYQKRSFLQPAEPGTRVPNSTSSSNWENFKEPCDSSQVIYLIQVMCTEVWSFQSAHQCCTWRVSPLLTVVWERETFLIWVLCVTHQTRALSLAWCLGKGINWTRTKVRVQNAPVSGNKALPNSRCNSAVSFHKRHPNSHTAQAYRSIREHPPL